MINQNKINITTPLSWELHLETKPDFKQAMERIYAWYEQEIIDRAPVKFYSTNPKSKLNNKKQWNSMEEKWFDTEYIIESTLDYVNSNTFLAETFPVYFPNLGPGVYASYYGCQLLFEETTSYTKPIIHNMNEKIELHIDYNNKYFKKIDELTNAALEACKEKFMVGYTDLHPGVDCVADWRHPQELCIDLLLNPKEVKEYIELSIKDFEEIYNYYDKKLKNHNQLSVSWMGIPSFERMHIPSCDFSSMISPEHFKEFCMPVLEKEVKNMSHNIFHLDGRNCARHLDQILSIKEICAIQWVQGAGSDEPIMQWIPLIEKIQNSGKSIVVYLKDFEVPEFISYVKPKGIYLHVISKLEHQLDILKKVEKWK